MLHRILKVGILWKIPTSLFSAGMVDGLIGLFFVLSCFKLGDYSHAKVSRPDE